MMIKDKSLIGTIVFLVILMFATTSALLAQEVSFTPIASGVNIELAVDTGNTVTVEGKTFPIHTLNGKTIVKAMGKKGEYAVYIGNETTKTHEGIPLREYKGKLIKLKLSKSGYPYCQYGN